MFQKISLKCAYQSDAKATYNWGSLMHGALMELLTPEIADRLHEISLRPFSQYVLSLNNRSIEWHIGLWDDEISAAIKQAVMAVPFIDIKHIGIRLNIETSEINGQSEKEFLSGFFTEEIPCRRYELEFITPCTHKSGGRYVIFPTPELIIQSLYMRYCAFSQEFSIDDAETMAQLAANLRIVRYSLHSAQYNLEGANITGYVGKITFSIHGPEQLVRLAGMLLSFAEYAGVGIKTSLGMGGCRVRKIPKLSDNNFNIMKFEVQ